VIREERDPAFWQAVADHPRVAPSIFLAGRIEFANLVTRPDIVPLATDHGGFLFHRQAGFDDLHALFTPQGWGREVNEAVKRAYEDMIRRGSPGFRVVEVSGLPTSRPPLSHGWRLASDFAPGPLGLSTRFWTLSIDAWRASPAARRTQPCPQQ